MYDHKNSICKLRDIAFEKILGPTATIGQLEISINSVISSYQWKTIAYILSKTQGSRLKITWEKLVTAGPDLSTFMT